MRVLKNIMSNYFDSHCHPDNPPKIGAIVNSSVPSDWSVVISMTNHNIIGAIGVHPWHVSDIPDDWAITMQNLLQQNPDILIGEIGLDKHKPDMETQTDVFVRQFDMAIELNRGVCLHCVGAWERIAHILKAHRNKLPPFILAHGYNGPINLIKKFADEYNMYFSYGPRNLSNPSRIKSTPMNRILSETDSAHPESVIGVVKQIADILHIDPDEMTDIIYDNTIRMLKNEQAA